MPKQLRYVNASLISQAMNSHVLGDRFACVIVAACRTEAINVRIVE